MQDDNTKDLIQLVEEGDGEAGKWQSARNNHPINKKHRGKFRKRANSMELQDDCDHHPDQFEVRSSHTVMDEGTNNTDKHRKLRNRAHNVEQEVHVYGDHDSVRADGNSSQTELNTGIFFSKQSLIEIERTSEPDHIKFNSITSPILNSVLLPTGNTTQTDYFDSETTNNKHDPKTASSIVVVVDNSNIFIGARETVCNNSSTAHASSPLSSPQQRVKPKHVKLRLQQLLSVAENNRQVTCGFTAGSSPPASEQVWEVYR